MKHPDLFARITLLTLAITLCLDAAATPFVVEDMPADLDGVVHPWSDARKPVGVDFNGDGEASWYAGGNRIAHPKTPTPLDPLRYGTAALPAISLPACPSCTPRGVAFSVADFNSDGIPDIARIVEWVGQTGDYTLQVYLGSNTNAFTLGDRRDWTDSNGNTLGTHTYQTRVADFDNDGDADIGILSTYQFLATVNDVHIDRGNLRIRWNNLGAFATETTIQSQHFSDYSQLTVADFDGDTDVDILVNFQTTWNGTESYTAASRFFTNQGTGVFTATTDSSFDVNFFHEPQFFADLDRNGWPELVTASANLFLRKYHPDTGWSGYAQYGVVESGVNRTAAVAADMNEDGILDIVTVEGPAVAQRRDLVLHQTGFAGSSQSKQTITSFTSNITQIGTGDARGDADSDLLIRLENGSFKFVRNTAQRLEARFGASTQATALAGLTRIEAGDTDRDGIEDLLALKPLASGSHMEMLKGNGVSGFAAPIFKILANTPSDFSIGDFNNDSRMDYAYVVPNAGAVRTVIQNDSGFFSWTDSKIADFAGASTIATGNVLNDDEYDDLFAGSNTDGALMALRNSGTTWSTSNPRTSSGILPSTVTVLPDYLGLADSPLACGSDGLSYQMHGYTVSIGWGQTAQLVQVQDIGQTGKCATANLDTDRALEVLFMTGTGGLAWWNPTNTPASPYTVIDQSPSAAINGYAITDWTRDGLEDVLTATDTGVYLYSREGLDDHWSRRRLSTAAANDVTALDINRDSLPDAAYTTSTGVSISLNVSAIAEAGDVNYPGGLPVVMSAGQSAIAFDGEILNPGRFDEDASIAITRSTVYFKKVVYTGDVWSPGAAMTRAEVEQAVASVSILMDGLVIGTAGTAAVAGDGSLQINYSQALGNLVPIAAASNKKLEVRVTLKPTAGSASYTEFMVVGGGNVASVISGSTVTSRTSQVGPAPYNLVRINPNLFANGFE